jgi:hypothetical protein
LGDEFSLAQFLGACVETTQRKHSTPGGCRLESGSELSPGGQRITVSAHQSIHRIKPLGDLRAVRNDGE